MFSKRKKRDDNFEFPRRFQNGQIAIEYFFNSIIILEELEEWQKKDLKNIINVLRGFLLKFKDDEKMMKRISSDERQDILERLFLIIQIMSVPFDVEKKGKDAFLEWCKETYVSRIKAVFKQLDFINQYMD